MSNTKSKKKTEQRIDGAKKRRTAAEKQAARDAADKAAFMEKLNADKKPQSGLPGTDSAPIPLKKREGVNVPLPYTPVKTRSRKARAEQALPAVQPEPQKKKTKQKAEKLSAPASEAPTARPKKPGKPKKPASPLKIMALGGLHEEILAAMADLRVTVDSIEKNVSDESWPLPKYREMLFVY